MAAGADGSSGPVSLLTSASPPSNPFDLSNRGKKTALHSYCNEESRRENACVFVCLSSGQQTFARDICFDPEDPEIKLKDQLRWWDRLSLFGPVRVRHVEIKFLCGEKLPKGFEVVVLASDQTRDVADMDREISSLLDGIDVWSCGVDVNGKRDHQEGCNNEIYDEAGETPFCRVLRARQLRLRAELIKWTHPLLDYFWQHRAHRDGIEFLNKQGFVHTYKDLAYDRFTAAEEPYGRSIDAIELVRGWKVERVLWTTLLALVCDVCVVAIATLLTHSLQGGLAAGSCAAAIQAIPFAILTMLSAVLA